MEIKEIKEVKEIFKRLNDEQKHIEKEARIAIVTFLKTVPEKKVSLVNNPAYALIEGCDSWFEDSIYGVALRGNTLCFSMDTDITDELEDVTSWNSNHMVDEHADYIQVNWLSVLEAVSQIAKPNKNRS